MNTMWCGFDWLFLLYGLYCPCCKLAEIWRKTGQYSHLDMFKSLQEYRNINTGIELVNVFYWLITCWWPRCSHVSVFGPLAAFMEQVKWSTVKHVGGPLIFRNMMLRVHPHIFGSGASSQGSFFCPPKCIKNETNTAAVRRVMFDCDTESGRLMISVAEVGGQGMFQAAHYLNLFSLLTAGYARDAAALIISTDCCHMMTLLTESV